MGANQRLALINASEQCVFFFIQIYFTSSVRTVHWNVNLHEQRFQIDSYKWEIEKKKIQTFLYIFFFFFINHSNSCSLVAGVDQILKKNIRYKIVSRPHIVSMCRHWIFARPENIHLFNWMWKCVFRGLFISFPPNCQYLVVNWTLMVDENFRASFNLKTLTLKLHFFFFIKNRIC